MQQPTYDDANLILRLYEMRREDRMRKARDWFTKNFHASNMEEFQKLCPPGSDENASFRMVVTYWEMVASFIASGVLNPELFFETGFEMLFVYERVSGILPTWRDMFKNQQMMGNLEKVARQYIAWQSARAPEWHGAFQQMVRGVGR